MLETEIGLGSITGDSLSGKDHEYPSVSVIIVNFNGKELLRRCVASILTTNYPSFQIVIVDNASTDGSVELTKKLFGSNPRLKIVENRKNLGHAEGCNVGARVTTGKYLVFLDSDTEMETWSPTLKNDHSHNPKNWLLELVKVMESDKSLGIAQAKIVLAKDNRLLDYTCMAIDALGSWNATYGSKESELEKNLEILAASSGCSIVRRKVFDETGGFDPDYFIYDDDTDFSLRTRLFGYNIVFVPSAVMVHHGSVLRGIDKKTVYHSAKNRICTMLKNYELKNLWWRFSVLVLMTCMVSVGFLLTKKFDEAKATMKGLLNPMKNFRKIWLKRMFTQSRRRVRDKELKKKGLIRSDILCTLQDFKLKMKQLKTREDTQS